MKLKKYLTEILTAKSIMETLLMAALNKSMNDKSFRALAIKHLRRLI